MDSQLCGRTVSQLNFSDKRITKEWNIVYEKQIMFQEEDGEVFRRSIKIYGRDI